MKRNLSALTEKEFDLVIIGGGIFAACAAWDAVLRGLSVALIEKEDFSSGSSANSFKMIHGGIRYLQHADLVRLRSSCFERSAMLRIAPHLVHPLPILIPTYGHGKDGKEFLGTGMYLYDLLTLDRNTGIRDKKRKIPWSRFINRETTLQFYPDLEQDGLTGGAIFYDGQMYNPTRLVLAFIRSACDKGAVVANYLQAVSLNREDGCVKGVTALDKVSGEKITIRSKCTLNAAGPWVERFFDQQEKINLEPPGVYSRDACFVIKRKFTNDFALAIKGRTHDPDALLSRGARHLFLVPWKDYTLVGVWHVVYNKSPDEVDVTAKELQSFIDEINWAYPSLKLTLDDVEMWNAGLVPFGENEEDAENLSYGKRSFLIDHQKEHDLEGLVSLIGVRYTTARGEAANAIDMVTKKLHKSQSRPATHKIPVHGGDIADFDQFVQHVYQTANTGLDLKVVEALIHNFGTAYLDVLQSAEGDSDRIETFGETTVLKAEVAHAIDHEMALKLSDVVFRRTDLATAGNPGEDLLRECASIMAEKLGWDQSRQEEEVVRVLARFPVL